MLTRFNKMRNEEGFTLIELLIVIIVLGILVAIVLFSLGTFKSDSQTAACKADVKQLVTAETAYLAKSTATNPTYSAQELVDHNYLQSKPTAATDGKTLEVHATTTGAVEINVGGAGFVSPAAATTACG
jgi:general secretion pathway protein G